MTEVTEVCDDAVSMVTNTTRHSDETGDMMSPYRSLLGLKMLTSKNATETDNTDKTLSPVLPLLTSICYCKEIPTYDVIEDSDHDSVMSESLLRPTGHTQHGNDRESVLGSVDDQKSAPENPASQVLFDDTQSSGDHCGTLPVKSVPPGEYPKYSTDLTISSLKPSTSTSKPCMSGDHGKGTKIIESTVPENCSGKSNSSEAQISIPCSAQSSGEIGSHFHQENVFHSSSTQSSREMGKSTSKTIDSSSPQSSREMGKSTSKTINSSSPQSSEEIDRQSMKGFHSSASRCLGKNSSQATKISCLSCGDGTPDSESVDNNVPHTSTINSSESRKPDSESEEVMTKVDLDEKGKQLTSATQKGFESQSTISPHERGSVETTEYEREETIFKKIIKQQDYVDRQLRQKSRSFVGVLDALKIKQHMETLQSLLRQLSNQHKFLRNRLTADVRSTSKTKQNRLRYKREIEQLGKRQKHLLQLVQRQKTLSSMLKDIENKNNGPGNQTSAISLAQTLTHQASHKIGSSQVSVTPDSKVQGRQDTQSSTSSRVTSEPCSQSLLLCHTKRNNAVSENLEQVTMPTKSFTSSPSVDNANSEKPLPRQTSTCTLSANLFCKSNISQQQILLPVNPRKEMIMTAFPIDHVEPERSNTRNEESSSIETCPQVGKMPSKAVPICPVEEHSVEQTRAASRVEEWHVSKHLGTSPRVYNKTDLVTAGLNTQRTTGNVPLNMTSQETLQTIPDQDNKQTSRKGKSVFVPPPKVTPQLTKSAVTSPPPSQHQMTSHFPIFKSPPVQNNINIDNISPSTASCSDVFPVKSSEINRRIQQRRLLAESQKNEFECEVPIPVCKPQGCPYSNQSKEDQRITVEEFRVSQSVNTVAPEQSEQLCSTPPQPKYPPLGTLIERGALVPKKDCLVTESKNGRYVGSLLQSGLIRGPGGEIFKTPVQWVSAVNDGVLVKKSRAYREVFYHGHPLITFVNPGTVTVIDLTQTTDKQEHERASNSVTGSDSISNNHVPIDLENLLLNCTVRLICDDEIMTSSDLPENFWNDDFGKVRLTQSLEEQIDCW